MLENEAFYPQLHYKVPHADVGNLTIRSDYTPMGDSPIRLALVLSYGFGGSNAAVVVSKCTTSFPLLEQQKRAAPAAASASSPATQGVATPLLPRPFPELSFLSHRTASGLEAFQEHLHQGHQPLHSCDARRFPNRGVAPLGDNPHAPENGLVIAARPVYVVYTGNGSQWSGMGAELLENEAFLSLMKLCGPSIPDSLRGFLPGQPRDRAVERGLALTALQIGLVSILRAYNVSLAGHVGHSAGEIAASFGSGACDAVTAMAIARARTNAAAAATLLGASEGAMAAVACGANDVESLLAGTDVVVACYNTPSAITLSGSLAHVEKIVSELKARGVKCKILDTAGIPHHNKALLSVAAKQLSDALKAALPNAAPFPSCWLSAVKDAFATNDHEPIFDYQYHVDGVLNPVDFSAALSKIPKNAIVLEVGPHCTLRPYVAEVLPECAYVPMMMANKSAALTVSAALASIWNLGGTVRNPVSPERLPLSVRSLAVSWDRHHVDLLDYSVRERNHIGGKTFSFDLQGEDSYLRDHTIDGRPLFPATGYVYCVLQAFGKVPCAVEFFKILRPVTLNEDDVELKVGLLASGECTISNNGEIVATARVTRLEAAPRSSVQSRSYAPEEADLLIPEKDMDPDTFYRHAANMGYEYGNSFRGLKKLNISSDSSLTYGLVEEPRPIAFLDAMLQLFMVRGLGDGLRLPTEIRRIEFQSDVPTSTWATHDKFRNQISCGGVTFEGVATAVASRRPRRESISFSKACLLPLGKTSYPSDRIFYMKEILRYGVSLRAAQPGVEDSAML